MPQPSQRSLCESGSRAKVSRIPGYADANLRKALKQFIAALGKKYDGDPPCVAVLKGHTALVTGIAVAIDGRCALSASRDETIRVWDLEVGGCSRILGVHAAPVVGLALTPGGQRAVSVDEKGGYRVWDVPSGKCVNSTEPRTAKAAGQAVTVDGKRFVSGEQDSKLVLHVWDADACKLLKSIEVGGEKLQNGVGLMPDGRQAILVDSHSGGFRIWDLDRACCKR